MKYSCVIAVDRNNGIGNKNDLPWGRQIPKEQAYFNKVTTTRSSSASPESMNAVIMGKNTWQSIPSKFRPLKDRLNVVLSSTMNSDAGVLVFPTLDHALHHLNGPDVRSTIDRVFVIGGARLYNQSFRDPSRCERIFITRVEGDYECDTFVDQIPLHLFQRQESYDKLVVENGVSYTLQLYVPFNHPERAYLNLLSDIIQSGKLREDRTGVGTISKFGEQLRFDLSVGFPLLTTKRVFFRGVLEELLWFLRGDTNSKILSAAGVRIWDGNGSREFLDHRGLHHYQEGELGPVYGFQWRHWGATYRGTNNIDYSNEGIDQIARALDLIKNNPNSRRIIISAWNVAELEAMALPPCHILAQFQVSEGKLNCSMYQRSADMALGVPFNIASYALLTHLMAHATNLQVGHLVMSFGDAHVYSNHLEGVKLQLKRDVRAFPKLNLSNSSNEIKKPWEWDAQDITLENYNPHPSIKLKMAV